MTHIAMASIKLEPRYQIIDGIRFPLAYSPTCIKGTLNYVPKADDIFIVTYPKCGTTWMQNIALSIFRKGKELEDKSEFHRLSPYIDMFGQQSIVNMPRLGACKTHLPFTHVPYSPEAKYIYVIRNPKDCCVSFYYHTKFLVGNECWDTEFDTFFEWFMDGEVVYNDYFDHLASSEKYRKSDQVFFTNYENMKKDRKSVILNLASFLGREYIQAIEKDNAVLRNIIHFTEFEYMKKHFSDLFDFTNKPGIVEDPNVFEGIKHMIRYNPSVNVVNGEKLQIIRKGEIGDWKLHLSEEQSERLDKKFLERTKGTDIYDIFREFM